MAEQRQFRFRLPWMSAATAPPPTPQPEAPPPTEIRAPPRPTATISIQRPPFRPIGIVLPPPPPPPSQTPTFQPPATQRPGSVPPSPTRPASTEFRVASLPAAQPEPPIRPPPPQVPDSLPKSQSFVPVEELNLGARGEMKGREETGTEGKTYAPVSEDTQRNRVAEFRSAPATPQVKDFVEKEEIGEMKKKPDKGIEGSSSYARTRKAASSDFRNKAATSNGGEQVPSHREIREDISKLVQKLSQGHIKSSLGEQPASIITLAGKNMGATMDFGGELDRRDGFIGKPDESTTDGERIQNRTSSDDEHQPAMAFINSNTQSINNSIMLESVVNGRDPGVHFSLSQNHLDFDESAVDDEPLAHRAEFSVTPAEKLTHEPPVRSQCLNGLFLETSHCDPQNPDESQIHGCKDRDIEIL